MLLAAALVLAFCMDRFFGEPRDAWHPVAWFGRALTPVGRTVRELPPVAAFAFGALAWCAAVGGVTIAAAWVERWLQSHSAWWSVPLLAVALKPTFALRMLTDEVRAVEDALGHGVERGRERVARLCSRDVSRLDATTVRETAIETLGENFNDSFVAPVFWFAVAGLPGAWAWRATNTLDAMWGYRGTWEWAGKWAARGDDVLGCVPARLAALLLWSPPVALSALRREARRTPSPNGGWPMAALALRLGVRLAKPGVYKLNATGASADAGDTYHALGIVQRAALAALLIAATGVALVEAFAR